MNPSSNVSPSSSPSSNMNHDQIQSINTSSEHNPLLSPYGAPFGVMVGQDGRVEELNMRIMERKFPDIGFQPNFSPRPVMTKYTLLPIVDHQKKPTVKIQPYLDYYPEVMFHPGNSRGPISGYFNRIGVENELRCQTRPLVRCDDITKQYIPSTNSELYSVKVTTKNPVEQTHPLLFESLHLNSSPPFLEDKSIGASFFNNHTRTQVRCLS